MASKRRLDGRSWRSMMDHAMKVEIPWTVEEFEEACEGWLGSGSRHKEKGPRI